MKASVSLPDHVIQRYPLFSRASIYYRERRLRAFIRVMNLKENASILDVGGQPYFWQNFPIPVKVTCLNLYSEGGENQDNVISETYDGGDFPFEDQSFDVVHSNSVIEHVGDYSAQKRFANEIMRVGQRYWVQTPNYYLPFEPHAQFPCFQYLPPNLKLAVGKRWKKAAYPYADLLSIQLLTRTQLLDLFPGGKIWEEKVLFLAKSYSIYSSLPNRRAESPATAGETIGTAI